MEVYDLFQEGKENEITEDWADECNALATETFFEEYEEIDVE